MTIEEERKFLFIITMVCIVVSPFFISGCLNKDENKPERTVITPADSVEIPARGFYMGVLPVPGENQTFEEAYLQSSKHCEFSPVWGRPTPFYDLAKDLSGSWGETFVEEYIRGNGMFPLIQLSFIGPGLTLITPSGMDGATLDDPEWQNAYKRACLDVVKSSRPLYLSIGNEVNRWYEEYGAEEGDPNGFQHYVSLYEEIYDAIKNLSPDTRVFCTFAREIVSENREADLNVLSMFDSEKMDMLVFTSYPYAVRGINSPFDIPSDYYSKASNYLPGKPFGFSELGWPSMEPFGGEQGQADFIIQVSGNLSIAQGMRLHLLGWAWLHDVDENDEIGLIERDGTEKLAYGIWKNISTSGI